MPRYVVGIDLGTTNCAVASIDLTEPTRDRPKIRPFAITQLVGPSQWSEEALLPSFLYRSGEYDWPAGANALPWPGDPKDIVGLLARQQGAKVPGRLIASAKSWLCHPGVERTAPLLPWGAPDDVPRMSPVEASARYLEHLIQAWNHAPKRRPEDHLEEQHVVLTVPASFDDTARQLTAEAARSVHLKQLTLLEEPQAAFYGWLGTHSGTEAARLRPGMLCLVVDVGGGTTDFSLIRVRETEGELAFQREAVGDHLLLGGDNMDLALAKALETKSGQKLQTGAFQSLVQACRVAKENLLGPNPPPESQVTVIGRGRSIISSTRTIPITAQDVESILLDGFFPKVDRQATPLRPARAGLQELGLPYVADPGITRHLAAFLQEHLPDPEAAIDAILFNGGVFRAARLRERLLSVLAGWFGTPARPWEPLVLNSPSVDLAVAWGAAYAGYLGQQGSRKISAGMPRAYYLGVEAGAATKPGERAVVCVVPRGLAEGQEVRIPQPEFQLALGEPALFPVFASTTRSEDQAGQILSLPPGQLASLPPLCTVLRGGKRAGVKRVPVTLAAKCTEIGTLELYCVSPEGNRWRLEFNVRSGETRRDRDSRPAAAQPDARPGTVDLFPEDRLEAGSGLILDCFRKGQPTPAELPKALEQAYELSRQEWPTSLCRRLWDDLLTVAEDRRRTPQHLSRWYHLAGFSLRPGFGDPLDSYRVESLWKLFATTAAATGGKSAATLDGGADYWILWRRTAGGLNTSLQQVLWGKLKPALLPPKNKPAPKLHPNELGEMWRAAAALERLEARIKQLLAEELLRQILRGPIPHYAFWSLTRLAARQMLYGPLNTLVHAETVERWLTQLIPLQPTNDNERLGLAFCLAQLARKTGLRGVDIQEETAEAVMQTLKRLEAPMDWLERIQNIQSENHEDESRLFGDSLPIGLRLSEG